MTVQTIMAELQALGDENVKKIWIKHGIKEPFFGVKMEHLKVFQKKIKKDYELSKGLYATGNADAMYLAGLIADPEKMTKKDLQTWVQQAVSNTISEHTVPQAAAHSKYGFELAKAWIDAKEEHIAAAGWKTWSALVTLKPDNELDLAYLKTLLARIAQTIHAADNRVRHVMNGFIITLGSNIKALTNDATATAKKIGSVSVDMNGTACKVPDAVAYIKKALAKGGNNKK